MKDLNAIREKLQSLVIKVGAFIRAEGIQFNRESIEHKGLNDLVSYVDKTAEKMLVEELMTILPEAGIIAEEGTKSIQGDLYNWIIDPLDGTTNFVHKLPIYSISVALTYEDNLVLGMVYEIAKDECFYAVKNEPAFCNNTQISVSDNHNLSQALLATGFPYYSFEKLHDYLAILSDLMQNTHGLRRLGSAAVDLAYVACGRFEGFFEFNLNAWDVAAGAFIVQQAGGQVTDFEGGNNFVFGRQIVAGNATQPELLNVIQKHW